MEQVKAQLASVIKMVEALAKVFSSDDFQEDIIRTIHENALEVSVRSDWHSPGIDPNEASAPVEYYILLCTGGPAVRIIGELNEYGEPSSAQLQCQDWFTPWNEVSTTEEENKAMLMYTQCFYWSE